MAVNGQCTCGALLPPDARFCHKCGKPQYEMPVIEEEAEAPAAEPVPPVAAEPPKPTGISLRNPAAARAALGAGAITSLLMMVPLPALIQILWQLLMVVAGGFLSVWLYQRRTGNHLTVGSGARLGWITGIFAFLIMMVMFTLSVLLLAAGEGVQQSFREMLSMRGSPEVAQQFDALINSPGGLGFLLFGMLLTSFIMLTILATVGGALGAKVLEKE
jgi:hypothetical protein